MDLIARLLQEGLDHYGRNDVADAVRCWQQVLALAPDNLVARDYLEAAGADMSSMQSPRREERGRAEWAEVHVWRGPAFHSSRVGASFARVR